MNSAQQNQKPRALQAGDKVGIIAPASAVEGKALEAGCRRLRGLGYQPVYEQAILRHDLYFAGTVERRVHELHEMYARPEIRAIICARGGYGCNYLLPRLDADLIRANPKIFVGYSDATSLLTWLVDLGQIAFHGPMAACDFARQGGVHMDSWRAVMGGAPLSLEFKDGSVKALIEGTAAGPLYGGCLSLVVASLGTPFEVQTDGCILFLEDISAKPYQIDRMLMQLKLAGKLDEIRGILFGEMLGCAQPGGQDYSLQEVVTRIVADLGIPVAYGIPSGHVVGENILLPFGVQAELNVGREVIGLQIEAATTHSAAEQERQ